MTSLPEQFSAARMNQLDNGFNLMRSLGDQALDRTSRVLALQLNASRAALEQSSSAVRLLLEARDPRDLLALGTQSQQHLRTMFDFGRELFSIAASMNVTPLRNLGAPPAPAGAQPAAPAAPVADAVLQAGTAADAAHFEVVTSDVEPAGTLTPMAQATSEALDLQATPPHPMAASLPVEVSVEIELPKVAPVDAVAPVAAPASTGPTETRGTKGRRKQN